MLYQSVALLVAFFVYQVVCQGGRNATNGTIGGNSTNGTSGRNSTNGTGGMYGNGTDGEEIEIYFISADLVAGVLYQVVSVLIGLIYALGGFGGGYDGGEVGGNSTNGTNLTSPF